MSSILLLPKTQLVGNFIQDAEDAINVGNARAVAFEFFVEGWSGSGGGFVEFIIETASENKEDHFVGSPVDASISESAPSQKELKVANINLLASWVRVRVDLGLGTASAIEVKVQMNILG